MKKGTVQVPVFIWFCIWLTDGTESFLRLARLSVCFLPSSLHVSVSISSGDSSVFLRAAFSLTISILCEIVASIEHGSTAKKAMSIIRTFFSFYLKTGVILTDPSATLDNKNRTNRVFIQTLDDDEIEKMIESSRAVWNKTRSMALRNEIIIKLMLHYGLKTNDIQNFQLQDFNFAEKTLRILRTAGIYYILMAETDANLIQTYIEQYRRKKLEDDEEKNLPLFISSQNKNLSERSILRILMDIAENAGIAFPVSKKTLYGTFAQKYYDATGDTDIIKIIMNIDSDPYDRFIIRKNRVVLDIGDKAF